MTQQGGRRSTSKPLIIAMIMMLACLTIMWTQTMIMDASYRTNTKLRFAFGGNAKDDDDDDDGRTPDVERNIPAETVLEVNESENEDRDENGIQTGETDDKNRYTDEMAKAAPRKRSAVHFLLFVGLEGTGHHLWDEIMNMSPLMKRFKTLDFNARRLHTLLYDDKRPCRYGLWSGAECKNKRDDNISSSPNMESFQKTVADEMRILKSAATNPTKNRTATIDDPLYIPVNIFETTLNAGMMSYPNFYGETRPLQYPNADVWFEACEMANVTCDMVYLHRDPYAVIRSTMNRDFHPDSLTALQLYVTMLGVIHQQLSAYSRSVEGCWDMDYFSANEDQHVSIQNVLEWRGENGSNEYHRTMSKLFKPPNELSPEEKASIVPKQYRPFLRSMVKSHKHVVELCQRLYRENHINESRSL